MLKKNIIISGVNLFEGGPLSILIDCLKFVNSSRYLEEFKFIALVHKKELFAKSDYPNIDFIEFPKSRASYLYRLYYEYFYFKTLAKEHEIFFWFSLHDITPNIGNIGQAVYCHNPSPFNTLNFKDLYIEPIHFIFRLFYKYLYKINIKKNKYVIVQQLWIKNRFKEMFNLDEKKIITALPNVSKIDNTYLDKSHNKINSKQSTEKKFFFPTLSRPFKNIEVICEAVQLMIEKKYTNFKVIITVDGSENKYAKSIIKKYKNLQNVDFKGLIKREEVYKLYSECDGLIFPSKLETWGLPISEFKQFNKPIFVSDLPYAKETVGNYEYVNFFNPNKPAQLSQLLINAIENKLVFDKTQEIVYSEPFVNGWNDLFEKLLKE